MSLVLDSQKVLIIHWILIYGIAWTKVFWYSCCLRKNTPICPDSFLWSVFLVKIYLLKSLQRNNRLLISNSLDKQVSVRLFDPPSWYPMSIECEKVCSRHTDFTPFHQTNKIERINQLAKPWKWGQCDRHRMAGEWSLLYDGKQIVANCHSNAKIGFSA